jgi:hypothetical protein
MTWTTCAAQREFVFSGGIILILNRKLNDLPEVKALATRVPSLEFPVNEREIAALMRSVALRGYRHGSLSLDAAACLEVADFIIAESARLNRSLDMRLLVNAFADRLQAEEHHAGCSWPDLVYSTLCGRPSVSDEPVPVGVREQKRMRELEVAREITGLDRQERLRIWRERTGASEPSLYRRLAELGRLDDAEAEPHFD